MKKDIRNEFRYYTPLFMGFILMMIGLIAPPIGDISSGAIFAGGSFLILCATIAGLDIPATLKEIRLLKQNAIDIVVDENHNSDECLD